MSWKRFLHRRRWHRERAAELDAYLEAETADNLSRGLAPAAARAAAHRKLGNSTLILEDIYRANSVGWLDALARDLRLACRLLRRSPVFALVAMISLALGIGGNVAIMSLVDAVAYRPLPVAQPQQLIRLGWVSQHWSPPHSWSTSFQDARGREADTSFSYPLFQRWQASDRTLNGLLAYRILSHVDIGAGGHALPGKSSLVSGDYETVLGLHPALGRAIAPADLAPGAPAVAVLDYDYWQTRFGGDPGVVGRTITVNSLAVTVIGIQPAGFHGLEVGALPDVYLPLSLIERNLLQDFIQPPRLGDAGYWFVEVVGRLRPGVGLPQARTELELTARQAAAALPPDSSNQGELPELVATSAVHGVNNLGEDFDPSAEILSALTGLVMLIVGLNLANLLLARASARAHEFSVRLAIGAGRLALIRQLLAESLVLSVCGAVLSLPVALIAARAMVQWFIPAGILVHPVLDARALAGAAVLALVAALLIGVAPALHATHLRRVSLLGAGTPRATHRHRAGEILLVAQVALCLLVLSLAGLFLRTLHNLRFAPVGLDPHNLTLFHLDAPLEGYSGPRLDTFYATILARLRESPGISAAASTSIIPGGSAMSTTRSASTVPNGPSSANPQTRIARVSAGFFAVYRIRFLEGRDFNDADTASAPLAVIVNRTMATRFSGQPLGRKLYFPGKALTVVGVVPDAAYYGVRNTAAPVIYLPLSQQSAPNLDFVVRSSLPAAPLERELRAAVASVDPRVPVYEIQSQDAAMGVSYQTQSVIANSGGILGGLALLLAAIGLYGLMAYEVTRRTREIGVRMALGASRGNVLRLVLSHSVVLVLAGAVFGLPLAWFGGRALQAMLFGVSPADPAVLSGALSILLATALAAAWLPALRASRLDPLQTLREE